MSKQAGQYRHAPGDVMGVLEGLCFGLLPRAVVAALLGLLVLASPARAALSAGGTLRWLGEGEERAALAQASHLRVAVRGMLAVVELEQRFHNTSGAWQEGLYSFPLPEGAAVRRLDMQVGERLIVGRIREREQAGRIYRQAREEGRKATLVSQQRPNLFTNRIANVAPGERVTVTLQYVQAARYRDGVFSLRIPTTITPRYIPGVQREPAGSAPAGLQGWAPATDQVPDAPLISPWQYPRRGSDRRPLNPLSLELKLEPGMPLASLDSRYHRLDLQREGDRYHASFDSGVVEMDRDLLLEWRPRRGQAPTAALFTERVKGQRYGLLMVLPPDVAEASSVMSREQVLVIDTSGSMGGEPIARAREALARALDQLRARDTFNVIAFAGSPRALFAEAQPANRHNLARAREFLRQLSAAGGTEMRAALARALEGGVKREGAEPGHLRQVIFITDGAVGNERALFDEIVSKLGASRLFTVGIGAAPNHWFMQQAASLGRGFSVQIANRDELDRRMDELFRRIDAPLASDLSVDWPASAEPWPRRIPDLYRGEPLVQLVRLDEPVPDSALTVSGRLAGAPWSRRVAFPAHDSPEGGIASLWARRKMAALLAGRSRGVDPAAIREAVLPLALEHQLLSPYTSFVAVEEQIAREPRVPLRRGAVPNTRPRGQAPQPYAYPQTATTAPARAYLGLLALFVALLVYVMRRPEEDRDSRGD